MSETNGRDFFEGVSDTDSLAAVARAAARRARDGHGPAQRPGVEEFMRAQEEFNRVAAGSLKLVARHLQFLQAKFEELEKEKGKKEDEAKTAEPSPSNAREELTTSEHVSEISRGLAELCARFEGLASRLSDLERKVEAGQGASKERARKATTKRGGELSRKRDGEVSRKRAGASSPKRRGRGGA
ncbi:MAG TPA: hypothetical protein VGV38_04525 [Pyrinomonadaceae bacterium]|nr:hypothetical protein [Pyrinomonadaceae bacterium]